MPLSSVFGPIDLSRTMYCRSCDLLPLLSATKPSPILLCQNPHNRDSFSSFNFFIVEQINNPIVLLIVLSHSTGCWEVAPGILNLLWYLNPSFLQTTASSRINKQTHNLLSKNRKQFVRHEGIYSKQEKFRQSKCSIPLSSPCLAWRQQQHTC